MLFKAKKRKSKTVTDDGEKKNAAATPAAVLAGITLHHAPRSRGEGGEPHRKHAVLDAKTRARHCGLGQSQSPGRRCGCSQRPDESFAPAGRRCRYSQRTDESFTSGGG